MLADVCGPVFTNLFQILIKTYLTTPVVPKLSWNVKRKKLELQRINLSICIRDG